ncbi:uncharacterized protein PAE49_015630 isoform 1-T1 [Odontesthes bonariensis]
MSSVQHLREFISQRLTAAAEEIFSEFEKTIVQYEEEIDRQRGLLDISWKPQIKLHTAELSQQDVCKEENVLAERQLCDQESNSSVDQEEPEPPQIKEEQDELCPSQGEQLVLSQETDTFMPLQSKPEGEEKLQETGNDVDQYEEEIDRQRRLLDITWKPRIKLHTAELSQQDVCKEENVLADWQLCDQESNSSVDQEEPEPPQIKEEQDELCPSQGEQLVLSQETDTFMPLQSKPEGEEKLQETGNDVDQYEEEIDRQRGLLDITWKPRIILHRIDLSQQHVIAEENILSDQQLCNQEGNTCLNQKEPRQKTDFLLVNPAYEECDPKNSEPNSNRLHSHNSALSVLKGQITEYTDEIKPYTCNALGERVSDSSLMKYHKITHAAEKFYSCKICGKRFGLNNQLVSHLEAHTGEKPFSCNTCEKRFTQKGNLLSHMKTHTGEKPYSCKLCEKRFTQNIHLLSHMRTHTGEKPFSCKECGKSFKRRNEMVVHMRTHTGEKPFSCNTCEKRFTQKGNLLSHMTTHTVEKPYSCKICEKSFKQRNEMVVHMTTHTGEKPYSCKICEKRFSRKSHLRCHMRTHTGEKPYSCKECGKSFTQRGALSFHMTTHTGEKPYSCKICEKRFSRKSHLRCHMRTHTGEKPYSCKICAKSYSHSYALTCHMTTHTGEKPFSCNTCEKRFSRKSILLSHMTTHTGEKPFSCNTCEKRFSRKSYLLTHMRTHPGEKINS